MDAAVGIPLFAAVEGQVDDAVVRRLIDHVGGTSGTIYGRNGKGALRANMRGYNHAAGHYPWIVVVDLNNDAECAPPLRNSWNPSPSRWMCFRVAVREVEAWLMADGERFARFLSVSRTRIPPNPDSVLDPKRVVVDIARHSRRKDIRLDIAPRVGSGLETGPAYTSRMIQFASDRESGWRPDVAAGNSESLRRSITRISQLLAAYRHFASGAR